MVKDLPEEGDHTQEAFEQEWLSHREPSPDTEPLVKRVWHIGHPALDGPLVLEGYWSENVVKHFGMMHIMRAYPDYDFGAAHMFTIQEVK